MDNQILYVILNNELRMSAGKAAAQAVHATMMIEEKHRERFTENYRRTVVVLGAKSREQMDGIVDYLVDARIDFETYVDEGVNEVDAFSFTAIAVEPIRSDDEEKRQIFAGLSLYGHTEDTDEYDGNYTEPIGVANNRAINAVRSDIQALRGLISPSQKLPQLKWYQRIFKRKQKGFVS